MQGKKITRLFWDSYMKMLHKYKLSVITLAKRNYESFLALLVTMNFIFLKKIYVTSLKNNFP